MREEIKHYGLSTQNFIREDFELHFGIKYINVYTKEDTPTYLEYKGEQQLSNSKQETRRSISNISNKQNRARNAKSARYSIGEEFRNMSKEEIKKEAA